MLVNAKIVGKGGRMIIMAMTDLHEDDEIFLDYCVRNWADKADRLTPTQAEEVTSLVEQRGVQVGEVQPIVSSPMEQAEVEVQATRCEEDHSEVEDRAVVRHREGEVCRRQCGADRGAEEILCFFGIMMNHMARKSGYWVVTEGMCGPTHPW